MISFSLLSDGGPFVWLLIFIGFIGLLFIFERILFLHRGQIRSREFIEGIQNNLKSGHYIEAMTVCEESPGPIPRIVKAMLLCINKDEARIRLAAEESAILEIPLLERRAGTILALAKITPLIGLAGTVFALLHSFLLMKSEGHYASADLFFGDTASALTATGLGIVISAVFYFGHHFICGRIRAITNDIEYTAISLIKFIVYELPLTQKEDLEKTIKE